MQPTQAHFKGYRLPDFMIPGAAKSGTTTLYKLMLQHPDIYFPASRKEPFYFSFQGKAPSFEDPEFNKIPVWKTEEYLSLYQDAKIHQLCGDASTSYLYMPTESIDHMRLIYGEALKQVKIIIILRNPVERAYSHYTYLIRNGFESRTFEEAISEDGIAKWRRKRWGFDYLNYGMYCDQVAAFQSAFANVKVLLMEDLKRPQSTMNEVFQFLGLSSVEVSVDVKANPSGVPKNKFLVNALRKNPIFKSLVNVLPASTKQKMLNVRDRTMEKFLEKEPMDPALREKLQEYFRGDIQMLSKLINRDLSHWLTVKKLR